MIKTTVILAKSNNIFVICEYYFCQWIIILYNTSYNDKNSSNILADVLVNII